jgi:hypothetical protein
VSLAASAMLWMRSGNGTMASWLPLSRLYTCTTALSACAAKTCELLTASPFCAEALFLKTWRCAASGWCSCRKMPASLVTPVFALVCAEIDATNCSVSMLAETAARAVCRAHSLEIIFWSRRRR